MTPRIALSLLALVLASFLAAAPASATVDVLTTYATLVPGAGAYGLEPGPDGYLFVCGQDPAGSAKVWKIAPGGAPVIEVASGLVEPKAMAFDAAGNLYVTDWLDRVLPAIIVKFTPGGARSTFATVAGATFLEFNNAGDLLVSTWGGLQIKRVTPAGVVSTYAAGISVAGEEVSGLVYDALTDELYFGAGPWIKKLGPGGAGLTTIAGNMVGVIGLVRGTDGHFYVSRYSHRDLYRVTPGGVESPYAGVHLGSGCIDGPRLGGARFSLPAGLAIQGATLFIADLGCHTVRSIDLDGASPANSSTWGRLKAIYR